MVVRARRCVGSAITNETKIGIRQAPSTNTRFCSNSQQFARNTQHKHLLECLSRCTNHGHGGVKSVHSSDMLQSDQTRNRLERSVRCPAVTSAQVPARRCTFGAVGACTRPCEVSDSATCFAQQIAQSCASDCTTSVRRLSAEQPLLRICFRSDAGFSGARRRACRLGGSVQVWQRGKTAARLPKALAAAITASWLQRERSRQYGVKYCFGGLFRLSPFRAHNAGHQANN